MTVDCTGSVDDVPEGSVCIPIHGSMKVGYYGSAEMETRISKSLLNLIERGTNEDWFITDQIQKVAYAGDEHTSVVAPATNVGAPDLDAIANGNQLLSGVGIGIIVAACAALVLGTALLAKRTLGKKKEVFYEFTPSPNAGKRGGLRGYDSESIRADFDDECLQLDTHERRTTLDPFEVENQEDTPSMLLESRLNELNVLSKNTILSTISEGSRETGSTNACRLSGLGSPPVATMQSFTRILSESTYSDGLHSLGRSDVDEEEYLEFDDGYVEPAELFGTAILKTPPPSRR